MNVSNIVLTIYLCILGYNGCYSSDQNDDSVILNDQHSKGQNPSENPSENPSGSTPPSRSKQFKFVTLDIKNCGSTDKITYNSDNNTYTFTPKDGCVIGKVTRGDTVLWSHEDYGSRPGSNVVFGKNEQGEDMFRVIFNNAEQNVPESNGLTSTLLSKPRPLDQDVTVPQSDSEDDDEDAQQHLLHLNLKDKFSTDRVVYEDLDGIERFTAVEPYSFALITKGNYEAWKYETGKLPYRVLVLRDENGNSFIRIVYREPKPKKLKTVLQRSIKHPKTEAELIEPLTIPVLDESQLEKELNTRYPFDLDVQSKSNTKFYEHMKEGHTHVYTAQPNFLFNVVRFGDVLLWTAKDKTEYVNKVEYTEFNFPGMYQVNLYHLVGDKKKFIKNVGPWRQVDLTQTALYTVNLDSIFDTFGYENSYDGNFGIFDAKSPFLFNKIIQYNGPGSNVTNVWEAKNPSEYAKRVVIDGAQPFQNTNFVMVIFNNNKRKYFLRINNQWVEVPY